MGILGAFNQPQRRTTWQVGDWLLLGVKLARGDEHDVWFIRLSTLLPDPPLEGEEPAPATAREFSVPFGLGAVKTGTKFTAPVTRLMVETYDEQGVLLRSSIRTIPQVSTDATLLDVLAGNSICSSELLGAGSPLPISSENMAGVMTMMQIMGSARALNPIRDAIREHIVKRPTILGLLLAGLRVNVEARIDQLERVQSTLLAAGGPAVPRAEAKFPVSLSGQRLFDCRVVVGPPNPLYNLTAGALVFEAVHPDNADNRVMICVLTAKQLASEKKPEAPRVASRAR